MLLSPIQNGAILNGATWLQARPRLTQLFGLNPKVYAQFGMKGHNGLDFSTKTGTDVFSPCDGKAEVVDSGKSGYGLHIKITKSNLQCVLGHLSEVSIKNGDNIKMGQKIAKTGNTGFSTGPHLHFGARFLDSNGKVADYDNGYFGYFDPLPYIICWKGGFNVTSF